MHLVEFIKEPLFKIKKLYNMVVDTYFLFNGITVAQRYLPGKERKSPYYLELIMRLPPHSVTKVSIDMDYLFLKWQEYPPDANHGFYMEPAVVTALLPIARNYTALPLDGSTITSRSVCVYFNAVLTFLR